MLLLKLVVVVEQAAAAMMSGGLCQEHCVVLYGRRGHGERQGGARQSMSVLSLLSPRAKAVSDSVVGAARKAEAAEACQQEGVSRTQWRQAD